MVSKDADYQPAIRVEFAGKDQVYFLALHKIAKEVFDMRGATLARMVLCDFVKNYRDNNGKIPKGVQQMVAILKVPK